MWTNNDGGYNLRETVKLGYDENQYDYLEGNISDSEYYYTLSQKRLLTVLIIVIPIVGLIIATMLIRNSKVFRQDGYSSQRGLGANYHRIVTNTHRSSSGGGGCACACACACADALEKISIAPSCILRISIKQLKVINKTIYGRGVNVFNISIF